MDTRRITRWILMGGIGAGAGALAAYLADPELGEQRRTKVMSRTRQLLNRVRHDAKMSLRDTQHHLAGMAAELRSHLSADEPSSEVLEQRIRSRIGRVISRPRSVHVLCDHGLVTLWGRVPKDEIYRLLHAVRTVPGVREIR